MKRIKRFNQLNEAETLKDKMTPKSDEQVSAALKKLHEDYVFKTSINDCTIEDHILIDIEDVEYIEIKSCVVFWNYELQTSTSGIDYIAPRISKIDISVEVFIYNEDKKLEKQIERDFTYDIMNSEIDYNYEGDQKLPFAPHEIYIEQLETIGDKKPNITLIF